MNKSGYTIGRIAWIVWCVAWWLFAVLALYPGLDRVAATLEFWTLTHSIALFAGTATWTAAVIALTVAFRNEARARHEKLQRAKVVSADIAMSVRERARAVAAWASVFAFPKDAQDLEFMRSNLVGVADYVSTQEWYFDRETLFELTPLPESAAHRIAHVQFLLRLIEHQLGLRMITVKQGSEGAVRNLHTWVADRLSEADKELLIAESEVLEAARLDEPVLPDSP